MPLDRLCVVGASDAAFDNLPEHRSQAGHIIGVAPAEILDDHENHHSFVPMEWKTGRIKRVVRSTLAAEAYGMGTTAEGLEWFRAILAEMKDVSVPHGPECRTKPMLIPGALVTDAKSLYDVMVADRLNVADRRLSLEAALIRQQLKSNIQAKWVRSEQMIADCLTKSSVDSSYMREVWRSASWTLGPDVRAPSTRKRALRVPESQGGGHFGQGHFGRKQRPSGEGSSRGESSGEGGLSGRERKTPAEAGTRLDV